MKVHNILLDPAGLAPLVGVQVELIISTAASVDGHEVPGSVVVRTDVTGRWEADLTANDAPGIAPTGTTWQVTEFVRARREPVRYSISVPSAPPPVGDSWPALSRLAPSPTTPHLVYVSPTDGDFDPAGAATTALESAQEYADSAAAAEAAARDAAIAAAISALVAGAPGALNTLLELANQLTADESAATALAALVATKAADNAVVKLAGGQTVSGAKDFTGGITKAGVAVATTADVTAAVSALVAGAPGALDTLLELANQIGTDEAAAAALASLVATKASTTQAGPLAGSDGWLKSYAANPDLIIAGAITRDANGAATSAPVVWPDGSPGTYTATTVSSAFPGAVDAYTITYGSPVTKTVTQPAVARDAASGAVTTRPALTVA